MNWAKKFKKKKKKQKGGSLNLSQRLQKIIGGGNRQNNGGSDVCPGNPGAGGGNRFLRPKWTGAGESFWGGGGALGRASGGTSGWDFHIGVCLFREERETNHGAMDAFGTQGESHSQLSHINPKGDQDRKMNGR